MAREAEGIRDYYAAMTARHGITTESISFKKAAEVLGVSTQTISRLTKAKMLSRVSGGISVWSLARYIYTAKK